jgi:hypothetical protein
MKKGELEMPRLYSRRVRLCSRAQGAEARVLSSDGDSDGVVDQNLPRRSYILFTLGI